jgi:hypothetical protein
MAGYLIDTNVLSEVRKGARQANPQVWSWWLDRTEDALFLSVITLGEIRKGIERLRARDGAQALALDRWLERTKRAFKDQMIEITEEIADEWGKLQAIRPLPELDALLAASALHHSLTLVTRNEPDFAGLGVTVINPFRKPPEALPP